MQSSHLPDCFLFAWIIFISTHSTKTKKLADFNTFDRFIDINQIKTKYLWRHLFTKLSNQRNYTMHLLMARA